MTEIHREESKSHLVSSVVREGAGVRKTMLLGNDINFFFSRNDSPYFIKLDEFIKHFSWGFSCVFCWVSFGEAGARFQ